MRLTSGWERMVTLKTTRADAMAGVLGALLVLPQGLAFATLAGLPPQYGIFSAIVPTIVAAVFGSSRHVVSGPTNANSLAIMAAISPLAAVGGPEYVGLVLAVTIMVGVIQLGVGAFKLGFLTDFMSPSVLLGFMSGAAALIACYAMPELLGLTDIGKHGPFGEVAAVARHWRDVNIPAVAIAVVTLAVTFLVRRLVRPAPFMLCGLLAGWAVSEALRYYMGETGVARVGALPSPFPSFGVEIPSLARLSDLLPVAGALAIIALGQSVSIAKAVAARSGQRIDVNREFVGQGLSNIAGGFSSSYLSCGSLNRSVPNLEAGAKTPLAAVFSALFLVALVAVAAPLLRRLPSPAIAALLAYTAWSLFDARRFIEIARISRIEFAIAAVTFGAMLVAPFHIAILIGVSFSVLAYLYRTSRPRIHTLAPDRDTEAGRLTPLDELAAPVECPQLKLVRIEGSAYFGAAQYVGDRLHEMRQRRPGQKRLLVMAKSMNFIDLAGAELWELEASRRRMAGGDIYFHRPRAAVLETWEKSGFLKRLGEGHIFESKREAIGAIYSQLDPAICAGCTARIFRECGPAPASATVGDKGDDGRR
jgi:SulP family sulfate permease